MVAGTLRAPGSPVARSLAAAAGVGLAAAGLAAVRLPWRPETVCPLRAVTGVPCPFCGGTTALVRLGAADVLGAVAASPLTVLAVLLLVLAPWGLAAAWRARPPAARSATLAAVVIAAEVWQLARFDLLG